MAFFDRKKMSKDDVLAAFDALSDDDKKSVADRIKPTTGEQISKAREDIREKGADSQTERDRIDESVAAQERADDDRDSQDAKDRVDESIGEKRAEDRHEDRQDRGMEDLYRRLDEQSEMIRAMHGRIESLFAEEADEDREEDKLEASRRKYGLSSHGDMGRRAERYTDAEIERFLRGR